jgi:hypothetical protein
MTLPAQSDASNRDYNSVNGGPNDRLRRYAATKDRGLWRLIWGDSDPGGLFALDEPTDHSRIASRNSPTVRSRVIQDRFSPISGKVQITPSTLRAQSTLSVGITSSSGAINGYGPQGKPWTPVPRQAAGNEP